MGSGNNWNLTDNRLKETIKRLEQQDTLSAIARGFGVHLDTLSNKLSELGYNHKDIRKDGITSFKRRMMIAVEEIEEVDKMVKLGLDFLKMYDKDVVSKQTEVDVKVVPEIKISIDPRSVND